MEGDVNSQANTSDLTNEMLPSTIATWPFTMYLYGLSVLGININTKAIEMLSEYIVK